LSTKFNENPSESSRPFDKDRDGFVMGEGGCILILEEMEHAIKRGAKIYTEVKGYGMSSDAYHYTLPEPTGDGAFRAMKNAILDANLIPSNIEYINAHGTSTPSGDKVEVNAIDRLYEDNSFNVAVSSTKSQIGHLLGAAGAVEAAYSIMSLEKNTVPFNLNLKNEIESNKISFVRDKPREIELSNILSNSFGFGGTNVSLIFSKIKDDKK